MINWTRSGKSASNAPLQRNKRIGDRAEAPLLSQSEVLDFSRSALQGLNSASATERAKELPKEQRGMRKAQRVRSKTGLEYNKPSLKRGYFCFDRSAHYRPQRFFTG